jgi:hypothetical protein
MTNFHIKQLTSVRSISLLWLAGLLVTVGIGSQASAATPQTAGSIVWSAKNISKLQKLFADPEEVDEFLTQIVPQTNAGNILQFDSGNPTVMDYNFEDMDGNGRVELLARLDFSGRGISYYLIAVYETSEGFDAAVLNAGGRLGPLSKIVVDLGDDGRKEILDTAPLASGSDSASPVPTFVHIYQFSGGTFYRADSEYTNYYQNELLPALQKQLSARTSDLTTMQEAPTTQDLTGKQAEINAIKGSIAAIKTFLSYH